MLFEATRTFGATAVYRKTLLAGALFWDDHGERRARSELVREEIGGIGRLPFTVCLLTVAAFLCSPLFFLSDTHRVSDQV